MRLGDLDVLKEMLIKERDAIPVTKTERYGFGVDLPNPHGMSMRGGINKAFRCMEKVPTIDAVPVVRCKDCKGYRTLQAMTYYKNGVDIRCCPCELMGRLMKDDDFCSYGERKDGEG